MIKYMDFVKQVIKTSQTLYARDTGSQGYLPLPRARYTAHYPNVLIMNLFLTNVK